VDIDIALNNLMGKEFTDLILSYTKSCDNKFVANPEKDVRSVGVIKTNPEQSKHLETATTHIFGESIDFVNLRSEKYASTESSDSNSRIPTEVSIGTPIEDAFRRDLTINALFFNITQQQIEDYTGRGLKDLKRGYIRTPLEPRQTFLDDPLRILRTIRFAR